MVKKIFSLLWAAYFCITALIGTTISAIGFHQLGKPILACLIIIMILAISAIIFLLLFFKKINRSCILEKAEAVDSVMEMASGLFAITLPNRIIKEEAPQLKEQEPKENPLNTDGGDPFDW